VFTLYILDKDAECFKATFIHLLPNITKLSEF